MLKIKVENHETFAMLNWLRDRCTGLTDLGETWTSMRKECLEEAQASVGEYVLTQYDLAPVILAVESLDPATDENLRKMAANLKLTSKPETSATTPPIEILIEDLRTYAMLLWLVQHCFGQHDDDCSWTERSADCTDLATRSIAEHHVFTQYAIQRVIDVVSCLGYIEVDQFCNEDSDRYIEVEEAP